jgi:UDP-sulfoquinovose synthase
VRILILGGDGYPGWSQSMYLSIRGYHVAIFDNLARRHFDLEHGFDSLLPIASLHSRVQTWKEIAGCSLEFFIGDTTDYAALSAAYTNKVDPQASEVQAQRKRNELVD